MPAPKPKLAIHLRGCPKGSGRTHKTCLYHILELKGDLQLLEDMLQKHFGFGIDDCNRSGRQAENENNYMPQGNLIFFMGDNVELHSDFDPWINTQGFTFMPAHKINMNYNTGKNIVRTVGNDENTSWRQKAV